MFETSVVREQAQAAEKRFGLLTVSVAVHSIVILAAIVLSVASISFPRNAPNQMSMYVRELPVTLPPPLGTPHPAQPAPHPAAQPAVAHQTVAPIPVTPAVIPSAIPTVQPSGPLAVGPVGNTSGNGPAGDPNGVPGGVGDQPATPAIGIPADAGPLQPVGDVKPAVVLHRVQPLYPHPAQVMHLNGLVVVECVIGRDGSIHDAHVITSTNAMFDQSALDAVRQWTFAPGSYHGQAVDTFFRLTVTFTITR